MKLRDKKVERILKAKGLQDAEIFHGPRKIWWTVVLIFLGSAVPLFPAFYQWSGKYYFLSFFLLFVIVGFVASGRYFSSIAVTDKELIVINPNPPFSRYAAFPLEEIKLVVTGSQHTAVTKLLCLFDNNYIKIGTDSDLQLFYCAGIDEHDGYGDEGLTEKTFEDLALLLQRKGITVQSEFPS